VSKALKVHGAATLDQINGRKEARERAWAQHKAQTQQRVPVEQREYEAGFDAGWWKRALDNEGAAVAALAELVRLKDLKDAEDDLAWTTAEKDVAWATARALLAASPVPASPTEEEQ
jgi:hypothetical protein